MLLLVFSGFEVSTATFCWAAVSTPSTDWTLYNYDFKDRWEDWASWTWGAIGT